MMIENLKEQKMKKVLVLLFALLSVLHVSADDKYDSAWIGELLGEELTNVKGEKVNPSTLKGKIVGLYFSAHWCPPCRQFTPKLVKFRDEMVKNHKKFEIVFISSDRSEKDMQGYMKETKMQWLAVPFNDARKSISGKYGITGIPTLIILGPDGSTITNNGRGDVTAHPGNAFNMWVNKFKNGAVETGGDKKQPEMNETASGKKSNNGGKKKSKSKNSKKSAQ